MLFEPKLKEKRWNPKKEEELIEIWEKEGLYKFNEDSKKQIFAVDTPPPYASGSPHMGFAIHYSQIDMIARYMRMKGYEVLFPMGIDRNGLPVEVQAEKEFKVNMWETPREKFLELCRRLLDKYEREILELSRRLGISANSLDPREVYRTDSPDYRKLTQATFIKLYKRGLIYKAERPNNWCPRCRTTIADAEVEYKETETLLVYIKFKIKETGEDLIIATTRPELLAACRAVIVHPDDGRYKHLHNKTAIVPIYNHEIPIIPHKEANPEFGTGAVMICSYGDYTDVRLFRELKLRPVKLITPEGKLSEKAGKYKGLSVVEARKAIIDDLKKMGLVVKIEKIVHKVPVCWRCKTPLEFIPMEEYYLKQTAFVEDIKRIANEIKFHPASSKVLLDQWLDAISADWPISRRRYYGTEIPLWYCAKCGYTIVPEPGKYYQPWKERPPIDKCPRCGSTEFIGETRTFDTWMDSSISPLYITGYMKNEKLFRKAFPVGVRPQGKDIVRTWLYYTLLRVYLETGKPAFKHVWISGHVVDEHGRKMSKSLGNIINPNPLIERYGADALRFLGASEAKPGSDIRFSELRLRGAAKFIQKLYSIARFVSKYPEPDPSDIELTPTDKWILGVFDELVEYVTERYNDFDFFAVNKVKQFMWNVFADHYLEMIKARANGDIGNEKEQKAAWWTLHQVLRGILKLLAPVTPFITDYIYRKLYGKSVHKEEFPKFNTFDRSYNKLTELIIETNSAIWKTKKTKGLSLKSPIKKLYLPEELRKFIVDLKAMHKAEEIVTEEGGQIKIKLSNGREIGIDF